MHRLNFFLFYLTLSFSYDLYAYMGPGMGGGFIVSVLSIFLAIFIGIFGILYYPIKRYFRKKDE